MPKHFRILIIYLAVASLLIFGFSRTALGQRILLENTFVKAIREFLESPAGQDLHACDYKDGEILLVKPVATGVGDGAYQAGDIVEIRDGTMLCERFGTGNFLGDEERTTLLPLYYPKKLTEEQKEELTAPEYYSVIPAQAGIQKKSTVEFLDPRLRRDDNKQKMAKRRSAGVDYGQILSTREILKVRSQEKIDRIPEVDLSNIIDKQSIVSYKSYKSLPDNNLAKIDKINKNAAVVNLPKPILYYEKARNALKQITQAIVHTAIAQSSPTEVTKTVDTGGYADYLSLNTWEAGQQEDLTDTNEIRIAKCRHATATSTADTTAVEIDGWTTSATQNIKIWTDPNEPYRHNGKWDEGKYKLEVTNDTAIRDYTGYIRVDGLQIKIIASSGGTHRAIYSYNNAILTYFSNNIIRGVISGSGDAAGIHFVNSAYVWNNIVYDFMINTGLGIINDGGTSYFYNNTVYNCNTGIYNWSGTIIAKNNLVYNNTDNWSGSFSSSGANNLSGPGSDAQIPSTGARNGVTVMFANASTTGMVRDLRLAPTDTGARDWGTSTPASDTNLSFTTDIDGQARPFGDGASSTLWDIGADEFRPTPIYRSVGPSKTTNLASSTASWTMTISGSTATFSTALPNNIGVGDVIVYKNSGSGSFNSLAFIHGRNSDTSYTVKDVGGHIATSTSASTNWQIYRAYTSLDNAVGEYNGGTENTGIASNLRDFDTWSEGKNLASSTEQWNIACYGDATDSTDVKIESPQEDGNWVTSASTYIRIYTPYLSSEVGVSQRHSGKWDDSKYNLVRSSGSNYHRIQIRLNFVHLDGLQIWDKRTSQGYLGAVSIDYNNITENAEVWVSNCIIRATGATGGGNQSMGIELWAQYNYNQVLKVWNNIIYDFNQAANNSNVAISVDNNYGILYAYNNTVYNCRYGIRNEAGAGATLYAKNNIVQNAYDGYSGTFASDDYNISNLAGDSSGSHSKNGVRVNFVNTASSTAPDLHLSPSDVWARNNGSNLYDDAYIAVTTDIDGDPRPVPGTSQGFDIGADETRSTVVNAPEGAAGGLSSSAGLVGYWSFNGQDINWGTNIAYDRSSSSPANNATIINMSTTTSSVTGVSGQALKFDGADDYLRIADKDQLDFTGGAYTFVGWIYPKSYGLPAERGCIIDHGGTVDDGWAFVIDDMNVDNGLTLEVNGVTEDHSNANAIALNTWQHVAVSVSGGNATFYVNGVSNGTGSGVATPVASNQVIGIGARTDGLDRNFDGLIDEVRIYNRALSASEISDLYRTSAAKMKINSPPSAPFGSATGLVGYWSFNGPDINWRYNAAYDRSSTRATGTLYNMSTTTSSVTGISGQALKFDGVDDYVNVGTSNLFFASSSPITVSAWIYPRSFGESSGGGRVISRRAGSDSYEAGVEMISGIQSFGFVWSGTASLFRRAYSGSISLNQWAHIVATWDGSLTAANIHLYKNGTEVSSYEATQNGVGLYDTFNNITNIGNKLNLTDRTFDGNIDEVRIYNRVLSDSEIQSLYKGGARKAETGKY